MGEIIEDLLARVVAKESLSVQHMVWRLLLSERPAQRPEQSEVCGVEKNDVLGSIERHLTIPSLIPPANGFPAELLADLAEGRRRRLGRQRDFDAFARSTLGSLYRYAVIPRIEEQTREVVVTVLLAGMAEIRRLYVYSYPGWHIGAWPLGSASWAILPHPDAPTERWQYAAELPDALAQAEELGRGYREWRPPAAQPKSPTWQERMLHAVHDGMQQVWGHLENGTIGVSRD